MSDAPFTITPQAYDIARQAARRVHRQYERYTHWEDLQQEALSMLTTKPELQEVATEETLGLLQRRLEMDLLDLCRPMGRRQAHTVSLDALASVFGDGVETYYEPLPSLAHDYNREMVETLLPAVWDESYCYGLPKRENAPDPDMPKGSVNKARGNNLSAYIADIKVGWAKATLTRKERRALLMAYGLGWTQKTIAAHEGVSQQTISERIENAIGKIVTRLNGGLWAELMEGIEA